ncbi:nuclease-related domain-containing protein [Thalassotalea crassostreae]|uniref:nuclease-related domain-containing protein n=1 Tax=Thalassotalea crassostreae TaxID=1763536 RepID=UPI000839772B|nr:nuclease-related domain-containing protein [Thalassotalea crassostreae]
MDINADLSKAIATPQAYYQSVFSARANNDSICQAALYTIEQFLDGKYLGKASKQEKTEDFWQSPFLFDVSDEVLKHPSFTIALSQYFYVGLPIDNPIILDIANRSAHTLINAIRYSEIVTDKQFTTIPLCEKLNTPSDEITSFLNVFTAINNEFQVADERAKQAQHQIANLSCVELLMYCARYIFETILPTVDSKPHELVHYWHVINELLKHNLIDNQQQRLQMTERDVALCAKKVFMSDLIAQPNADCLNDYQAVSQAMIAQSVLVNFTQSIVEEFCYNDDAEFYVDDGRAYRKEGSGRQRDICLEKKQSMLNTYWQLKALDVFEQSKYAGKLIGTPENHEENQIAVLMTMVSELQLSSLYGIETIKTDNNIHVNVFDALLAMNLTSAFYQKEFIERYKSNLTACSSVQEALSSFMLEGLLSLGENRFPVTFSKKKDKINRFMDWTVNDKYSNGNRAVAKAVVDFWQHNLAQTANTLNENNGALMPLFNERPLLNVGSMIIQMPWVGAFQNNTTAAVNNLRRIGARRADVKSETSRIEENLSRAFRAKGVTVLVGYHPPKVDDTDPGEIDLICALGDSVLVIEVKSSFIRNSRKEQWLHKVNGLRKADSQISRKVAAVQDLIQSNVEFCKQLKLPDINSIAVGNVTGLIVGTSLSAERHSNSGHLITSLEETLIALWDDPQYVVKEASLTGEKLARESMKSLFPNGFTISDLMCAIQSDRIFN